MQQYFLQQQSIRVHEKILAECLMANKSSTIVREYPANIVRTLLILIFPMPNSSCLIQLTTPVLHTLQWKQSNHMPIVLNEGFVNCEEYTGSTFNDRFLWLRLMKLHVQTSRYTR